MKKRAVSIGLWFYAGWYLWAILADAFHLVPAVLGPFFGALCALVAFAVLRSDLARTPTASSPTPERLAGPG